MAVLAAYRCVRRRRSRARVRALQPPERRRGPTPSRSLLAPLAAVIAGCGYPQSQRERTSLAIASFGAVGAARTEDGLGSGWALRAGAALGAGSCTEFHFGLRYERIEYADDTAFAVVAEMAPVTWWDADSPWGVVGHLGWAYRWTEAGNRGTGPSIGAGLFVRLSRGLLLSPYASACLSFGSREDEFDVDFEASASVDVALVF